MDQKTWLWGKMAREKTILETDKANLTSIENEEVQELLADKEKLEKDLVFLNDKLTFTLSICNAKDEQVKKQTKIVEEAVAGWEKAEAEMLSLKQHLEDSIQQQLVYEERVIHLDGALKECMQQLHFTRKEQEQRIYDAVMKASKEFDQARMVLEEQLSETTKRLAKSAIENSHLNKSIIAKDILIEDMKTLLSQAEADHNALMFRLESIEKDNTSLKYEARVLQNELDIRSDEREFNRRTADASYKQHLESVRNIAKLESECKRLHLLVRKRLPSSASLAKMKQGNEMLAHDSLVMRRKKLNSASLMVDSSIDSSPETAMKRITTLTEQLYAMEEENKTLKESLNRKMNEVQFSRVMLSRTASKPLQLESEIASKGQVTLEQPRSNLALQEFSLASTSDIGSDDNVSCAESWASALISELERFRSAKQKESISCTSMGPSDMSLMDDFVEMEKLAVVSVENATEISHASVEANNETIGFSKIGLDEITSEAIGKEIIAVSDHLSNLSTSNLETCSMDMLKGTIPGWFQDVVKVILEQNCVTHKNPDDILEDIKSAMKHLNNPDQCRFGSGKVAGQFDASNPPHFSYHTLHEPSNNSVVDPSGEVNDAETLSIKRPRQQSQITLNKSIGKIIELIEGIGVPADDIDNSDHLCKRKGNIHSHNNQGVPIGYMVRVFQWKTSDLSDVLQKFLHVCYNFQNGKTDHENFATELTTALEWIINHCFSLQDVSSMKDAIKKQFDWDETQSENEAEIGMFTDAEKLQLRSEQLSCLPALTYSGCHDNPTEEMQYDEKEEFKNVKDEVISPEFEKQASEGRLQSATNEHRELEKIIASLRLELQTLRESHRKLEDQMKNQASINTYLDAQHTETELKEAYHKILALEVELESKNNYCEELDTRSVELQLQLESMKKVCANDYVNQKNEPRQTDWEIRTASEKLAECQETIHNLEKQLKTMPAPKDTSLFDNIIAAHRPKFRNSGTIPLKVKNRPSLLDRMLTEDKKTTVCEGNDRSSSPTGFPRLEKILVLKGVKRQDDIANNVSSLAIVPAKKSGGRSLWKGLLGKRRKAKKKTSVSL